MLFVTGIPTADNSDSDNETLWPNVKPIDDHYNQFHGHSEHSIDSGMVWSAVKDTDNAEVCFKKELVNEAWAKRLKKQTYHGAKKRLQLKDVVSARIGPPSGDKLPSGRRSIAKGKMYGQILDSIEKNTFLVGFASGETRQMKSRMLTKASLEESQAYHRGLSQLMPESYNSQFYNENDLMTDHPNNQLSFSQTTLKNMEHHNLNQMEINLHDSFDPGCDSDSSSCSPTLPPLLKNPSSTNPSSTNHQPSSSPTMIDLNQQPSYSSFQEPTTNNHQTATNHYTSSSSNTIDLCRQSLPHSTQKPTYISQNRKSKTKRVKISSKSSSNLKSKTATKNNDAPKTNEMHKEELESAQQMIRNMHGDTYNVKSSNGSMDWEVVMEYDNQQPIAT